MTDLDQRLQNARISLLMDFPFFGQLALRMTAVIDPAVETAQTDGREVRFNPDYCEKLTDPQLAWLYAHEVAHPALGHLWRIGPREMDKVNRAADYVVNEMLESVINGQTGAARRMQRCPGALLDRAYYGLSMEEIYSILPDAKPKDQPGKPKDPGLGSPQPGQGKPQPGPLGTFTKPAPAPPAAGTPEGPPTPGEGQPGPPQPPQPAPDTLEQEWKQAAAEAATVARSRNRGNLPASIGELLAELFEPAVPWQDILRQFVSRICRDDYTFKRPNRRYAYQGFILPTLRNEGLGIIGVAVDTSGSIKCDDELLKTFLSELQGILDTTSPEKLHLLDCDARVHSHNEFTGGDDLRGTVFHGGGGTSFRPVFQWFEDQDITPDVLLYLTDMEGSFPDTEPPYPTLWLNYGNPKLKAPFGETIHIPKA